MDELNPVQIWMSSSSVSKVEESKKSADEPTTSPVVAKTEIQPKESEVERDAVDTSDLERQRRAAEAAEQSMTEKIYEDCQVLCQI